MSLVRASNLSARTIRKYVLVELFQTRPDKSGVSTWDTPLFLRYKVIADSKLDPLLKAKLLLTVLGLHVAILSAILALFVGFFCANVIGCLVVFHVGVVRIGVIRTFFTH
jgi:hypothetical protein